MLKDKEGNLDIPAIMGSVGILILVILMMLPLQGCITISVLNEKFSRITAVGAELYGPKEHLMQYDFVILVNETNIDTSKIVLYPRIHDAYETKDSSGKKLKTVSISAGRSIRNSPGNVKFITILVNRENFKSVVLDERTFKNEAHYGTWYDVKGCFSSDREYCSFFKWDRATPIYSSELQDTIYVYNEVEYQDEPHKYRFRK